MNWSLTDGLLVMIVLLLCGVYFQLEKIKDAAQTIEAIQKKRFFGD